MPTPMFYPALARRPCPSEAAAGFGRIRPEQPKLSRAFRSLLPQMVARVTGLQPPPTFVNTRGTPIAWTILRHTGHGNSDARVAARCVGCCPPVATLKREGLHRLRRTRRNGP